MGKLEGKVAIITGGGKGIGFGLAKAFAKEGANLTITGRTMSRLEAAKEKLEAEYGVKVLPVTADGAGRSFRGEPWSSRRSRLSAISIPWSTTRRFPSPA